MVSIDEFVLANKDSRKSIAVQISGNGVSGLEQLDKVFVEQFLVLRPSGFARRATCQLVVIIIMVCNTQRTYIMPIHRM